MIQAGFFCWVHLHVCENLFDVDAVLVVLGGEVGLFERTVDALLYHHVLRLAEGRGAARSPQLLRGEVLTAARVHVLWMLLSVSLPVVKIVEVGHNHWHW